MCDPLWRFSSDCEEKFRVHLSETDLGETFVTRFSAAALNSRRTASQIAESINDHFAIGFVLSGSGLILKNEEGVLNAGDLFIYDWTRPIEFRFGNGGIELLGFLVPKGSSDVFDKNEDLFHALIVPRQRLSLALRDCLYLLADRYRGDQEETEAILSALVSLIPIDAGCFGASRESEHQHQGALCREILRYTDENAQNPNLSPKMVAAKFRISERYLYKVLARRGLKFGDYLRDRRLEGAAAELAASERVKAPITEIAYKWGFSDLSSFNRAFKLKYGCSPTDYRET
jgi:AraC-like DNA-binding protein